MTDLEVSSVNHAAEEVRYQRTAKARVDAAQDKARRASADRAAGHSTECGLLRCAANCPKRIAI